MRGKTFDSFDPSHQEDAYEKAFAFTNNPRRNVLLYGNYRTGKTHLEVAICNYLREVGRLLPGGQRQPVTSFLVSAPQFFMVYEEQNQRIPR